MNIIEDSNTYFNLGDAYYKDEQYNDAINAYTNAIDMDNNNILYYSRRALCYLIVKDYASAEYDMVSIINLQEHGDEIYKILLKLNPRRVHSPMLASHLA